jgi:Bacterial PH domain
MPDIDLQNEIQAILMPQEKILWFGQPPQGLRFLWHDWITTIFMTFWTGFAVFWAFTFSPIINTGIFYLFAAPFILSGLYMLVGRFFYEAKYRSRMVYAVTNQRVLIRKGLLWRKTVSFDIKKLSNIELMEEEHNKGCILFEHKAHWKKYDRRGGLVMPHFDTIDDVKTVYQLILQQKGS